MIKQNILTARTEFASALNQICTERGISPEAVMETIKSAILAAYKKDYGLKEELDYEVEVDYKNGSAKIFAQKDKEKRQEITPPGFGRIAAQTAKQVILQQIREAEKSAIIEDYKDKIGQLTNGMILRFDGENIICDIGRGQAIMPPQEQVRHEKYTLNKRLTFYIKEIKDTQRGRRIIVSRSADELVAKLFKREVPEVSSGAVEIKKVAREPGRRSKVAVNSTQPGVDPVGSCVGQKGIRVQAVIKELGGEKIDIVQYSKNAKKFITAALSPAEKMEIKTDKDKKEAVVTIPEDQLSLAIGKEGQNVRLAAKLTGYKIDIEAKDVKNAKNNKTKKKKKATKKKTESKKKKAKTKKKKVSKNKKN